jgi:hypothetical protein
MRPIPPSSAMRKAITAAAAMTGISRRMSVASMVSGRIIPASPRIRPMLAIFEPTTLPIATSVTPPSAALTETTSSGIDVPRATTVMAMISVGSPKADARRVAERISHSPPISSPISPIAIEMRSRITTISRG